MYEECFENSRSGSDILEVLFDLESFPTFLDGMRGNGKQSKPAPSCNRNYKTTPLHVFFGNIPSSSSFQVAGDVTLVDINVDSVQLGLASSGRKSKTSPLRPVKGGLIVNPLQKSFSSMVKLVLKVYSLMFMLVVLMVDSRHLEHINPWKGCINNNYVS